MPHLDRLKISNRVIAAARPRRKVETDDYRRNKLIVNIEEKIELANLSLDDKQQILKRKRGHHVIEVRPQIWWEAEDNGKIYTQIRYNKIPLNMTNRGTMIEAGSLKRLPGTFRTVIRAVAAGELDTAIQATKIKSNMK